MKTAYEVKTRNWHGKQWIAHILNASARLGGANVDPETDNDNKYYIETTSSVTAWGLWLCWTVLSPLSGGWTYIVRAGHEMTGHDYGRIY